MLKGNVVVLAVLIVVVACQRKAGECPPPSGLGICAVTCFSDQNCAGNNKCCPTACGGTSCSRPVSPRSNLVAEKPGYCPSAPQGPWVCSSTCSFDNDCRGTRKCCKNRCGAMACIRPEFDNNVMP